MTLLDSRDFFGFFVGKTARPVQRLDWCPFCGTRFPTSLRDVWISILEEMGIGEPLWAEFTDIPEKFKSDKWWMERGL